MKRVLILGAVSLAVLTLTACSKPKQVADYFDPADASASGHQLLPPPDTASMVAPKDIPAGAYTTDPSHSSLAFTVNHLGFSHYTAHFTTFKANLTLDPAHPDQASLSVTIDPKTLELNTPPKGFHDELMGKMFFEADKYPKITFKSTKVETTGQYTANVTGDLTLHGVTKPVTFAVTFNGGYKGMAGMDPQARAGFSAKGSLKRSDFGMGYGVPAAGSNLGVSDEVNFAIETEMMGPPLAKTS